MKDGDFDRLRIPIGDEAIGDEPVAAYAQRAGVAGSPAQLAVGSAILAGLIVAGVAAFRRLRPSSDAGDRGD